MALDRVETARLQWTKIRVPFVEVRILTKNPKRHRGDVLRITAIHLVDGKPLAAHDGFHQTLVVDRRRVDRRNTAALETRAHDPL